MVPKLFAIHALVFGFLIMFLFSVDLSSRQPSSEVTVPVKSVLHGWKY